MAVFNNFIATAAEKPCKILRKNIVLLNRQIFQHFFCSFQDKPPFLSLSQLVKSLCFYYSRLAVCSIMASYQFEFFRHAPSQHNLIKDQWKLKYGGKSFKNTEEFNKVKYSSDLIDSNLILQETCYQARDHLLDFSRIELVICSPLRRCLETCKSLIQGRQNQLKVVVEPLLSCRIGAVWDIGSSPHLLQAQHPTYDFSGFQDWGELWQFKLLGLSRKINFQQIQENKESWPLQMLDYIRKEGGQNFLEFFKRTKMLKPRFSSIIKKHEFQNQQKSRILVVAHACVFSFMLGKELSNNGKGKVKDKVSFTHGQPKRFTHQQVLQQPQSRPQ